MKSPDTFPSDSISQAAAEWVLRHDRGLTAIEQDQFSRWLASDPRHRDAFALHRWGWEEMDRLGYDGVGFNEHHCSPYGLMNSPNLIAAARTTSAPVTYTTSGGYSLVGTTTNIGSATWSATNFINKCYDVAATLDGKDVPEEGRFMLVSPTTYYSLVNSGSFGMYIQSRDYSMGNGNVAAGKIYQIAGFTLIKTPLLPNANWIADADAVTAGTQIASQYQTFAGGKALTGDSMPNHSIKNDPFGAGNGYAADFSKTLAVCGHGASVGCVQKHDIVTESERKIEYQGTLMLGKLMTGFGVLRPECAAEITLQ